MLYKCLHIDFKLIPDKLLDSSKTAGGAKNGFDVSLAEEAKYEARLSFLLILEKKHKKSHSSHFEKKLFISSSRRVM